MPTTTLLTSFRPVRLRVAEGEVKSGALVRLGFAPDTPAVLVDDALHGGQPDARPVELILGVQALKHAEQPVGALHVKADAVVANEDHSMAAMVTLAHLNDRLFASAGVFDGV